MNTEPGQRAPKRSRRAVLALAGASGGAAAAALLTRTGPAAAGHDETNVFHLGQVNTAPDDTTTELQGDTVGNPVLLVENAAGPGIRGVSVNGPGGVHGDSTNSPGAIGTSQNAPGVQGQSVENAGVRGFSLNGDGLQGFTENGVGVRGESTSQIGVYGASQTHFGVRGDSATGIGGRFQSGTGGVALQAAGRIQASSVGSAVIPAGQNSVFVPEPAVRANSHVSVTLASDPGSRHLVWVEPVPLEGFSVHLSSAPPPQRPATQITYLVVEGLPA